MYGKELSSSQYLSHLLYNYLSSSKVSTYFSIPKTSIPSFLVEYFQSCFSLKVGSFLGHPVDYLNGLVVRQVLT